MQPHCFGFFHPKEKECFENCSFKEACRKYQEETIFKQYYEKYKKEKEIPTGLNLDDIIEIDEGFL